MLVRIEAERVLEVFERELESAVLELDDLGEGIERVLSSGSYETGSEEHALLQVQGYVESGKRQIRLARAEAALLLTHA